MFKNLFLIHLACNRWNFVNLSLLHAKFNAWNLLFRLSIRYQISRLCRFLTFQSKAKCSSETRRLDMLQFSHWMCPKLKGTLIADTNIKTIDQQTWNESHCRKLHQFMFDGWVTWTFQFAAGHIFTQHQKRFGSISGWIACINYHNETQITAESNLHHFGWEKNSEVDDHVTSSTTVLKFTSKYWEKYFLRLLLWRCKTTVADHWSLRCRIFAPMGGSLSFESCVN